MIFKIFKAMRKSITALRIAGIILLISFTLLCAAKPLLAADLTIEIPSSVVVSGSPFPLSEVAALSGNSGFVRKAEEILIDLPLDGVLSRDDLLDAIIARGIGGIRLKLIMPAEIRISLDQSLEAAVKRLSGWDWKVNVEPLGPLPGGRLVSPLSIPPGTGSATLRFADGRGNERAVAIRISWSQPAVVALRALDRGSLISPSDVTIREVRVMRSQPLASKIEEVAGRRLGRNLSAGEPVLLNLLSISPIIQRGEPVIITVRKPGFIIEVRGEALDAGAEGDSIRVRNLQSRAVIQAIITGIGRVEVR